MTGQEGGRSRVMTVECTGASVISIINYIYLLYLLIIYIFKL